MHDLIMSTIIDPTVSGMAQDAPLHWLFVRRRYD